MDHLDVVEYLVIADRDSDDDVDLYPASGPSVGASSVSIPLGFNPSTQGGVRVLLGASEHDHGQVLWSGQLDLTSGEVLISDWSMRPAQSLSLEPGSYLVHVTRHEGLTVRFTGL